MINLGDVMFDEGDVFGDGVNVASRLEGLARPGGICISDIVHQAIADRIQVPFRDMGNQRVKNISRPIRVWQWTPDAPLAGPEPVGEGARQRVQFATASDGVQIAWAGIGQGAPVLKAPNWLNHLEYEWRSPIWHPWLVRLAKQCRLVRFDQRGNGLSDWEIEAISEKAMASDMSTVAAAAELDRFALLGISQGCGFSVRYAVEHPEQVTCLVLFGGFLRGRLRRTQPDQKHLYEVGTMMIRDGWGSTNPVFRHFFTTTFMPDAQPEVAASFDELQRIATSPAAAMRIWKMNSEIDMTELAKKINVPTLVLHCTGDRVAPIEEGRLMAQLIPNATFVDSGGGDRQLGRAGDHLHQTVLVEAAVGDHAVDAAVADDGETAAEREQLVELRRDDDDRDAVGRELAQQRVDFLLGADIDAARRLVADEHFRLRQDGAREDDLLLVAAAQARDRRAERRGDQAQLAQDLAGGALFAAARDDAEGREGLERGGGRVVGDRERGEDAVALAVLGQIDDAPLERGSARRPERPRRAGAPPCPGAARARRSAARSRCVRRRSARRGRRSRPDGS